MTRLKNAIEDSRGVAEGRQAPMVNVDRGGQNGWMTDYQAVVSSASYVRQNLIAIVLEAPRGFENLNNPDRWKATLKAMFELHAQRIEGLNSTLTAEFSETALGGAGERMQNVTNVTRQPSEPQITLPDKYGKPFSVFLRGWITNLLMDPDTKHAGVVTGDNVPEDLLPDVTGATVLFIEPDPTMTKVVEAWLCTNMMPQGSGDIIGVRDKTAALEVPELAVTFTAITDVGEGVELLAQEKLDEINLQNANPNLAPAFVQDREADLKDNEGGYAEQADAAARAAIRNQ